MSLTAQGPLNCVSVSFALINQAILAHTQPWRSEAMDLMARDGSTPKERGQKKPNLPRNSMDLEKSLYGNTVETPRRSSTDTSCESMQKDGDVRQESSDPEGTAQLTVKQSRDKDVYEVSWDSASDPADPLNWPFWIRCLLIGLVSISTFLTGLSSGFFAPVVPSVMAEFGSTNGALGSFVVAAFVLGLATGLLVLPLSEPYGRWSCSMRGTWDSLPFQLHVPWRHPWPH